MWPIRTASMGRSLAAAIVAAAAHAGDQQEPARNNQVLQGPAAAGLVVDPSVRQRAARARARLVEANVVDRLRLGRTIGNDGGRLVPITVFDVELVCFHADVPDCAQRPGPMLGVLRLAAPDPFQLCPIGVRRRGRVQSERAARLEMRHRVLHRTLDVSGVHRAALRFVGVEQSLVGLPLEHGREFPTNIL
jgi:hypothetical protein